MNYELYLYEFFTVIKVLAGSVAVLFLLSYSLKKYARTMEDQD